MKEWWYGLSNRERKLISVGGVLVVILIVYAYIWNPLSSSVDSTREQVLSQQHLLQWMQRAGGQIKRLKAAGFLTTKKIDDASLLVVAEKTLADQKLSNYIKQVQQPEPKQLTLTMEQVPFDSLIAWLQLIWKQYGVDVDRISVKKTKIHGLVDVSLTLRR